MSSKPKEIPVLGISGKVPSKLIIVAGLLSNPRMGKSALVPSPAPPPPRRYPLLPPPPRLPKEAARTRSVFDKVFLLTVEELNDPSRLDDDQRRSLTDVATWNISDQLEYAVLFTKSLIHLAKQLDDHDAMSLLLEKVDLGVPANELTRDQRNTIAFWSRVDVPPSVRDRLIQHSVASFDPQLFIMSKFDAMFTNWKRKASKIAVLPEFYELPEQSKKTRNFIREGLMKERLETLNTMIAQALPGKYSFSPEKFGKDVSWTGLLAQYEQGGRVFPSSGWGWDVEYENLSRIVSSIQHVIGSWGSDSKAILSQFVVSCYIVEQKLDTNVPVESFQLLLKTSTSLDNILPKKDQTTLIIWLKEMGLGEMEARQVITDVVGDTKLPELYRLQYQIKEDATNRELYSTVFYQKYAEFKGYVEGQEVLTGLLGKALGLVALAIGGYFLYPALSRLSRVTPQKTRKKGGTSPPIEDRAYFTMKWRGKERRYQLLTMAERATRGLPYPKSKGPMYVPFNNGRLLKTGSLGRTEETDVAMVPQGPWVALRSES